MQKLSKKTIRHSVYSVCVNTLSPACQKNNNHKPTFWIYHHIRYSCEKMYCPRLSENTFVNLDTDLPLCGAAVVHPS